MGPCEEGGLAGELGPCVGAGPTWEEAGRGPVLVWPELGLKAQKMGLGLGLN